MNIRTYRISVGRFIIVSDFEKCELNAKKKTRYEKMWNSFEKKEKKKQEKENISTYMYKHGQKAKQSKAQSKINERPNKRTFSFALKFNAVCFAF